MNIRNFFFKYRSYTPIPIALVILYFSSLDHSVLGVGIFLLVLGESIRIWAVRYAGGATRTTEVGAPSLCTSGPFSRVRNPLYIGNMIIYTSFVLIAGNENLWIMMGATWAFFIIQYGLIVSLEEEALFRIFGDKYDTYRKNVPALFPRISPWNNGTSEEPNSLLKTLKTEKRTLQNIALVLLLIVFKNQI
ncbi:MAG: isoprenylcysteine carboxylmethyltransferase family protein [Candidatus Marinimicrobia bacterium]|nr:isoprenylcysteine carboxylmethyltransferase family protein [Candidatus Neomarinimicrobiota bacterium]